MDKLTEKIGLLALVFTMMSISSSPHPFLLVFCYLIHEAGHIFFAKLNRIEMNRIKFGSFKMRLFYDCSSSSYKAELWVCAGGIIFNLICFIFAIPFSNLNDATYFFSICNLSLALMNLYPASTLDGGRILKCILMLLLDVERAHKIFRIISFLFAFILWIFAVYLLLIFDSNASLFFISVFLLIELCFSA